MKYWRSLDELGDTAEFREFLEREFPAHAAEWPEGMDRREFLKLMGASLALAGFGACTRQPLEKIVPYVSQPPELVPGKPLYFATAMQVNGFAKGVIVESHEGRPTKIEGNPQHPMSLGATDVFGQATLLELYDPNRARALTHAGQISTWPGFLSAMAVALDAQQQKNGAGIRVLTGRITSPTMADQLRRIIARFPQAKWHQYESVGHSLVSAPQHSAHYRFDLADVVVALDADFLFSHPAALKYTRELVRRRRAYAADAKMNRLYVAESTPSITGAMADHRLPILPSKIEQLAQGLADGSLENDWVRAAVRDLQQSRGRSIVIAGEQQPQSVHEIVRGINEKLGNIGSTISYSAPADAQPVAHIESLRALVKDMQAGQVELLMMLGVNPVFTAPADFDFARRLEKVPMRVQLSVARDETSALCHWHIAETHFLESWSDARGFDGTTAIVQPLILPLYDSHSPHELLDVFTNLQPRSAYEIVREFWQGQKPDFEKWWRKALHDGVIAHESPPQPSAEPEPARQRESTVEDGFELVFRPDPSIWDGRFASNPWLLELPKPITRIVWGNAALISPASAAELGVANGDLLEIENRGRKISAPAFITPGQADRAITLHLGYGGMSGVGFNAYAIRTSDAPWFAPGARIRKIAGKQNVVTTQHHHAIDGREIFRAGTVRQYRENPDFAREMGHPPAAHESLYEPYAYKSYAWGMAIDLSTCTGCNACVVACQAENNLPVVGKEQVAKGREMHWIRVDSYFRGSPENPEFNLQPVPCMHCEKAPCEVVCPVAATVHDSEGLNVQIYNRCIGTRYCSNNCPYKVRRFNFLEYNGNISPVEKLVKNPNVTVRTRGVMEKCTYCTQRINAARIQAQLEERKIRDGEVVPACAQACPAEAIIFGDINDRDSRVSRSKALPLNYLMLGELNTRPRTSYLAKVRNPDPALTV